MLSLKSHQKSCIGSIIVHKVNAEIRPTVSPERCSDRLPEVVVYESFDKETLGVLGGSLF